MPSTLLDCFVFLFLLFQFVELPFSPTPIQGNNINSSLSCTYDNAEVMAAVSRGKELEDLTRQVKSLGILATAASLISILGEIIMSRIQFRV